MELAELSRRLENIIRFGTIAQIDYGEKKVRVQTGDILTNWLNWRVARAGTTRTWNPPTVGEQVMILSPSGELANGLVMPSIYSDEYDAPSADENLHTTHYPDGAVVSYNHATGELIASGIQTGLIQASTSITLDTPMTYLTGQLEVEGLVTYHNGMQGNAGNTGNSVSLTGAVNINGALIQNGGQLSSNGIVLHTHTHPGTGGPQ